MEDIYVKMRKARDDRELKEMYAESHEYDPPDDFNFWLETEGDSWIKERKTEGFDLYDEEEAKKVNKVTKVTRKR